MRNVKNIICLLIFSAFVSLSGCKKSCRKECEESGRAEMKAKGIELIKANKGILDVHIEFCVPACEMQREIDKAVKASNDRSPL